jgi:hypothetical protein
MNKLNEKVWFTFVLFVFAAVMFFMTLRLGRVARFVPLAVAIPTLALLGFQLLVEAIPELARRFGIVEKKDIFGVEPLREKSVAQTQADLTAAREARNKRELSAFLWLSLMLLLIYLLGFLFALPIFSTVYLKKRAAESWLLSLTVGLTMCLSLYGIFVLLLKVELYEGLLANWLRM